MADIRVNNAAGLQTAISNAKAGDRILLAAGNYGDVVIRNRNFASDVTIMSASAASAATMNTLTVSDSSRLKFQGLEIGRPLVGTERESTRYAQVRNGSNITFDSVFFHGSMDNNASNDGQGLNITACKFVTIQNSRFEQLMRGVVFDGSTDITLRGNSFQNLRSDGADFTNVQRVTIDANTFRNFKPVGADHPDAIQFWTTGQTKASTDIVISNNQIFQGTGAGIQAIFMRDEVGTLPYQNVRILNNIAYVPDFHNGIAVLGGRNVEVTGNTVLSPTNDDKKFTIRLEKVAGGTVRNNVADIMINVGNTALNTSGNRWLSTEPGLASKLTGINARANATIPGLTLAGVGYVATAAGSSLVNNPLPGTSIKTSTGVSESFAPSTLADSSTSFAPAPFSAEPVASVPMTSAFSASTAPLAFSAPTSFLSPSAMASLAKFSAFRPIDFAA